MDSVIRKFLNDIRVLALALAISKAPCESWPRCRAKLRPYRDEVSRVKLGNDIPHCAQPQVQQTTAASTKSRRSRVVAVFHLAPLCP